MKCEKLNFRKFIRYRIYLNKHRTWSGKVNKRRPRISAAAPVRCLFEYFHKMIKKIRCNRCNVVLSQEWEFIFINRDVFQFKVSISRRSFIQFSLQNLRVLHLLRAVKAVNSAGTTSPTSLFLFPVTVAVRRLSAFACKKKVNKRDSSIGT